MAYCFTAYLVHGTGHIDGPQGKSCLEKSHGQGDGVQRDPERVVAPRIVKPPEDFSRLGGDHFKTQSHCKLCVEETINIVEMGDFPKNDCVHTKQ